MDVTTLLEDLRATRDETLAYYDLSDAELSRTYGPGKWSVRYILHHLSDSETVFYDRICRVLSEPRRACRFARITFRPLSPPRDEDREVCSIAAPTTRYADPPRTRKCKCRWSPSTSRQMPSPVPSGEESRIIPLALSEAMKTATSAISSSVMSRRAWVLLASNSCQCSQVSPEALARGSKASLIVPVSGMACGRRPTTSPCQEPFALVAPASAWGCPWRPGNSPHEHLSSCAQVRALTETGFTRDTLRWQSMDESIPSPAEITQILHEWQDGSREALDRLMPLVYNELHTLASRQLVHEWRPGRLQTTAVVNEAYVKLFGQRDVDWQNRGHFFAIAAQLMRRILVDHARRELREKHGGHAVHVELHEAAAKPNDAAVDAVDALDLDRALGKLEQVDPDQARIVELRFFGGLTVEETAAALGISPATVKREWALAKGWLHRELTGRESDPM